MGRKVLPGLALVLLAAGVSDVPERGDEARMRLADAWGRSDSLFRLAVESVQGPVRAHVERILDGDTIAVEARIWLGQSVRVLVRIDGIDTPELKGPCAVERMRAQAARDFLERRLGGGEVQLSLIAYDKFGGRVLANVADGEGDIAAALIAAGLARPYGGGTRQSWCSE